MTIQMLLLITLVIYLIGMTISFMTNTRWIIAVLGIAWFIPIIEIDNMFITVISSVMILIHIYIGMFTNKSGGDYE